MSQTVDELAEEVRSLADEASIVNVTPAKILRALNRAQRKAANIVARRFDEMFWDSTPVIPTSGVRAVDIPVVAYGKRIEKVECLTSPNRAYEIKKISNFERTAFMTNSQSTRPQYYSQRKNQLEFYPIPGNGITLELHFFRAPERLVSAQGRITSINTGSNYVVLSDVGDDLSTSTLGFNAYINFIDYNTGAVKGSAQILSLTDIGSDLTQLSIKTSGLTRSSVLGKTIDTTLPTDLSADDYVCIVSGTCVPELPDAYADYLVQYAVLDIKRTHGEPTTEDFAALKDLEEELQKSWAGRQLSHRVKKASVHWNQGPNTRFRKYVSS